MRSRNYLNLSLRSLFHLFVSGSLFYFARTHFNMGLTLATAGAFIVAVGNEFFEMKSRVENSFHTRYVFERDRLLAGLSIISTWAIVELHMLFAALAAPLSLLALTSYMDRKRGSTKSDQRNLIKPVIDITALTLGPLACMIFMKFLKLDLI